MTVRITKPEFNLREKISELDKPTGMKGNELLKSETTQEARNYISAGRKNYIINGDFQLSQRGDYTSATAISNQTYSLDRGTTDVSGVSATIQQKTHQAVGDKGDRYYKNTVKMAATSSATGYLQLRQKVETAVYESLYGKTVTVSAWVKSNHPNVRLRIESGNYGGTNWDSYQTHNGDGRWQKLSMTTRLHTSGNLVFGVILWGSTGGAGANHAQGAITSGDFYEFTDFQVELGGNATDFEHRPYSQELLLAQRYYQVHDGHYLQVVSPTTGATADFYVTLPYWVPMNHGPDVTESYTTSGATTNNLVTVTQTKAKFSLRPTTANSEIYVLADTLRLDAEL